MRIHFLGAARSVTGSMHLVEANGQRVLLDCGLFQGRRLESAERNRNLRTRGSEVDAIVLSHAHVDHCGNIPTLFTTGFKGRVFATHATADLAALMLQDSARIQERDVAYLERKGVPFAQPLYTSQQIPDVVRKFVGAGYHEWFDVAPGIRGCFQDAGHILGSASVHLEIREPKKDVVRVTFTGDLGRPGMPILRDPETLPEAEVVLTESTYGNRSHQDSGEVGSAMKTSLEQALLAALRNGGKLIIPAFSVGRTQNILYYLNELIEEGKVPKTRVFVDSPLAVEATQVIRRHPECFDRETIDKMDRALKPLLASHVELCRTEEESKRINKLRGTSVIVSASGMCEFGRILHHLKHNLEDPNAVVAFVGFQAHHTLGRRIVEGNKRVRIYGRELNVRARVMKLNGFSAHADRDELIAALRPLKSSAGKIFIVHGEEEPAETLGRVMTAEGFRGVHVPTEGEVVEI